jgi:cytochrome c553
MNFGLRYGYSALAVAALATICLAPARISAQAPAAAAPAPTTTLPWAYPVGPPAVPNPNPPPPDPTILHVPNSSKGYTRAQIGDGFNPPDWHPESHPTPPDVVAHGRREDVRACALCHLANGMGHPESSSIAGLPAMYIEQQVLDMKDGSRKPTEPAFGGSMIKIAKASNEAEIKTAAEYFSRMTYKPSHRIVEAKMVPKTKVQGMLVPDGKEMEPIGMRIIEMAEDLERTEKRDETSGYVAYVPPGALKKGEALVTKANSKTTQCAICHGENLKGLGNVPFLAGRSPSLLVRQMNDIKTGSRNGGYAPLMKGVVEKLSNEDMVYIAAYVSSLKPAAASAATH